METDRQGKEREFYTARSGPVSTGDVDQYLIGFLKAPQRVACSLFCAGYPHAVAQRMWVTAAACAKPLTAFDQKMITSPKPPAVRDVSRLCADYPQAVAQPLCVTYPPPQHCA
jgi:hypothetical protein